MTQLATSSLAESIPVGNIEAELMKALGAYRDPPEAPVHRARMSNLVIFCDQPDLLEEVQAALPNIVANHPARIILAIVGKGDNDGLHGSINVWCQVGGPQKICSEQITLRTNRAGLDHLPFAVAGLLTGDLPTNLWWVSHTPPPLAGNFVEDLAYHVQQILYDSIGWLEPASGIAATAGWLAGFERAATNRVGWRVAADLNWRRLKYWRRLVSQALNPNSVPGAIESISAVLVEHGPHAVIQAWELVSWLASRLGWQVAQGNVQPGVEFAWQVRSAHGPLSIRVNRLAEGPSAVRRLRIHCRLEGQPVVFQFFADSPHSLTCTCEGRDVPLRRVHVPNLELAELVSRQLSDRERDPIFRSSLEVAQVFAKSVL